MLPMARKSTITIEVTLDEKNVTEAIEWNADDLPEDIPQKAEAFSLSIWNSESKEALGLDLWSKQMTVGDMHVFVYQTLRKLADAHERATKEETGAKSLRSFAEDFARTVEIKK